MFVRNITRQPFTTLSFVVDTNTTVEELKEMIFNRLALPKSIQMLSANSHYFENNNDLLSSCGITPYSFATLDAKFSINDMKKINNFSEPISMTKDTFEQFKNSLSTTQNYYMTFDDDKNIYVFQKNDNTNESFSVVVKDEDKLENISSNKKLEDNTVNYFYDNSNKHRDTVIDLLCEDTESDTGSDYD
jgi:phage anti-repressor protein